MARGRDAAEAVRARQGQGGLEEGQGTAAAQPPGSWVTTHSSERRECKGAGAPSPREQGSGIQVGTPVVRGAAFVLGALGSRWGLPGAEDGPPDLTPWEGAAGPAKARGPGADLLLRGAWELAGTRPRGHSLCLDTPWVLRPFTNTGHRGQEGSGSDKPWGVWGCGSNSVWGPWPESEDRDPRIHACPRGSGG